MTTFTQSQLDAMVRDADTAAKRVLGDSTLADVCVHVKALASEVGRLQLAIDAAERLDNGQEVYLPQPHHRIVSIVAGNRMTMKSQQVEIERLQRSLVDAEQVRDQRWQMAKDAENEVAKLRGAIRHAGFEVCQTSCDWTIHDVSNLAAADEERTAEVISRNIDLEIENKRLQSIVDRLPKTADGVLVVPGIDRVWHPDFQGTGTPRDNRFAYWSCYNRDIGTCYSTREAAEKARSSR